MLDILKSIFTSEAGSFGFIFAILALLFFIVFKSGSIFEKFKSVDKLNQNVDKIKDDLTEVKAFITVFRDQNNPFAQRQSPVSLTDLGQEVHDDLRIGQIVEDNWNTCLKKVLAKIDGSSNPYDIQTACFAIGKKYSDLISGSEFDEIKRYAFNKGYNLSDFDLIFGVAIRDKYFKANSINVNDVDKHDPNHKDD